MNAYAAFTANQAIEQMLDDVQEARLARAASTGTASGHRSGPSVFGRAIDWAKRKLAEPVSDSFMIVPKLTDHAYRS